MKIVFNIQFIHLFGRIFLALVILTQSNFFAMEFLLNIRYTPTFIRFHLKKPPKTRWVVKIIKRGKSPIVKCIGANSPFALSLVLMNECTDNVHLHE